MSLLRTVIPFTPMANAISLEATPQSQLSSAQTFMQDWGGEFHDATIFIISDVVGLRGGARVARFCADVRCEPFRAFIDALGGIDGGGFSFGDRDVQGDLRIAIRHLGKAWAAPALGYGFDRRALCLARGDRRGVRRGVPRILFRTNLRSQARAGHGGVQRGLADASAAGN